jgi:hypothetical protein
LTSSFSNSASFRDGGQRGLAISLVKQHRVINPQKTVAVGDDDQADAWPVGRICT